MVVLGSLARSPVREQLESKKTDALCFFLVSIHSVQYNCNMVWACDEQLHPAQ